MSLSICRHMTYSSSSPFRPPSNRKVRLLPRDLYACVTRHGDILEIEEKLRERKPREQNGKMDFVCVVVDDDNNRPLLSRESRARNFCADEHRAKFLGTEREVKDG